MTLTNTLVPHGAPASEQAKALFSHLKELGFSCCLLSNNKEPRVRMFNDDVQVSYICNAHKPAVENYEKAMELMGQTGRPRYLSGIRFLPIFSGQTARDPNDHGEIYILERRNPDFFQAQA